MTEDNKHWTSKVKVFNGVHEAKIEETLNNFYVDKFVIATQAFPFHDADGKYFTLIVYFKIPPTA